MADPATTATTATKPNAPAAGLNDFTIQVATINGTGSQSANNILMRALFYMGIPVSGKNMFPSNIKGLPTWFAVRLSKDGYVARRKEIDFAICLNPQTARKDLGGLEPGGVCVFDEAMNLTGLRDDVTFIPVPFDALVKKIPGIDGRMRTLLKNIIYVGVAAELLKIDAQALQKALTSQFKNKAKAMALNREALEIGRAYVREKIHLSIPFQVQPMNETEGKIILDGNAAAALGALMGGCSFLAWYPITPSSSLCETYISWANKYRRDKDGKARCANVQAEDELASIGMVLAAAWSGARAMTATSGPGIDLMSEWLGYAYYAEIPAVVIDVQRAGPSTGLPTRTQQADILLTHYSSHGDGKHICVIPGTPDECYTLVASAFDIADRLQAPVFVLLDLDLGMNNWMIDPLPFPEEPFDRGKIRTDEQLKAIHRAGGSYYRYEDPDGDGIPYRTLPGNPHPDAAFLTRGSGHNWKGAYTEDPTEYRNNLDRIARKYDQGRRYLPAPILVEHEHPEVGLLAFGSSHCAVEEARDLLRQAGLATSYLRIRALPIHEEVEAFVARFDKVFVIEQNRDAQMKKVLKAELPGRLCERLDSILHYGGMPIDARTIVDGVLGKQGAERTRDGKQNGS